LPSIRLSEAEDLVPRKVHSVEVGGKGDKKHLGGFTVIDLQSISPDVWKYMISYFGVKSILDVGCGRGIITAWFDLHGVKSVCVKGSHDAIEKTMIPNADPTKLIAHDFSRGPWWPSEMVDAVWCVEFLEHVGRNFHKNFIPAFRKAALIFAMHSYPY
jgi:2-polyprenyl-3-methyl-5-hydroxy-6-metoxy-1,4-benzoquinol methylase